MSQLHMFRSRLLALFRKRSSDADLEAEIRAHLDALTQENIRRGMTLDAARHAARREFGGVEQMKEAHRDQRGIRLFDSCLQDLRFGIRVLRKNPGFTAVAVLTLALGIGANAAAFSLLDAVLLKPLPYHAPEQLFLVSETLPQQGGDEIGVSAAEYFDYRDRNHCFSQVAAYETQGFNLTGDGAPLRVNAARLTASTFPLLGAHALLGRTFTGEEDREGAGRVVVLSYALWTNHYGSDPHILGKIVRLDEKPYTVVGVMPPSFRYPSDGSPVSERADLWVPEAFTRERLSDRVREFGVHLIGRLKPGVTPQQAQADIQNVAANFMRQYPETYTGTVRVAPRTFGFASHSIKKVKALSLLLQAGVFCVLLVACANVANLLLARVGHRSREMAVRRAIGAGRARLVGQCAVESLLLSVLGGAGGLLLATSLIEMAQRFGPADVPQLQELSLNAPAVLFTVVLSLATTAVFGIAPAWRLSSVSPQESLKQGAQVGTTRDNQKLQNALVISEIALALVLLIGGSLLLQSFARLLNVPLGFRPDGVVVARTLFDWGRYPDLLKREVVQKELLTHMALLPGVTAVAAASHLPLSDVRQIGFRLEHASADDYHWAENSMVTPGYLSVMGIRLLHGRDFNEQDSRQAPNVAIVNEAFARESFAGHDPIGQRFYWGGRGVFTVIGVASDVRISALDADPQPMIYYSMLQVESGAGALAFVLRVAHEQESAQQGMFRAIQQQLWAVDKQLPLYGTTTLNTLLAESVAQRRFAMLLLSAFAVVALLLASVGLFGVVSYVVSQRRRELAMRMALGADSVRIGRLVLKQAAQLALAGCVTGLALFSLSSSLFTASLYNTKRFDPLTLTTVCLLLFSVAMFAAYWPARRAMRMEPLAILRYE